MFMWVFKDTFLQVFHCTCLCHKLKSLILSIFLFNSDGKSVFKKEWKILFFQFINCSHHFKYCLFYSHNWNRFRSGHFWIPNQFGGADFLPSRATYKILIRIYIFAQIIFLFYLQKYLGEMKPSLLYSEFDGLFWSCSIYPGFVGWRNFTFHLTWFIFHLQLPATLQSGVMVVVSPLLSLIQDQIITLNLKFGIPATFLNSQQTTSQAAAVLQELRQDMIPCLYLPWSIL